MAEPVRGEEAQGQLEGWPREGLDPLHAEGVCLKCSWQGARGGLCKSVVRSPWEWSFGKIQGALKIGDEEQFCPVRDWRNAAETWPPGGLGEESVNH